MQKSVVYSYPLFLRHIHGDNTYLKCLKNTNYFYLTLDYIKHTRINKNHFTIFIM